MSIIDITPIGAYSNAIQAANEKDRLEAARIEAISCGAIALLLREKESLRWLIRCSQRAVIDLYSFVHPAPTIVTSRAALTSGIIVVVLPTLLWWIV